MKSCKLIYALLLMCYILQVCNFFHNIYMVYTELTQTITICEKLINVYTCLKPLIFLNNTLWLMKCINAML